MRKEMQALIIIMIVVICTISVAGYMYYTEMQHKNEELNQMLKDVKGELEEVKNQSNNTTEETTTGKSSSSKSSKSSGSPVNNNNGENNSQINKTPDTSIEPHPEPYLMKHQNLSIGGIK